MKEFQINQYLSLRLEDEKTVIYVDGQRFQTCKYLLLNIEPEKIRDYDEFESIDAAVGFYSQAHERNKHILKPETEFWGHCSNLQAWTEYEYDTRLLDSRLAFPLLKRLTDAGDATAKSVFKEEIARRLRENTPSVQRYLIEQGYVDYLNPDELNAIDCCWVEYKGEKIPVIDDSLYLSKQLVRNLSEVEGLFDLASLRTLHLPVNLLKTIPKALINLSALEILNLDANRLTKIPTWIGELKNLRELSLGSNNISNGPASIGELSNLRFLNLELNNISELPPSFGSLRSLKVLNIGYNNLTGLPLAIMEFDSLQELNIRGNNIRVLPEFLIDLKSLKKLNISGTSMDINSFRSTPEKKILRKLEERGVKIVNRNHIYYSALGFIF